MSAARGVEPHAQPAAERTRRELELRLDGEVSKVVRDESEPVSRGGIRAAYHHAPGHGPIPPAGISSPRRQGARICSASEIIGKELGSRSRRKADSTQ